MNVPITQPFEWKCPREGCKRVYFGYTQRGVDLLGEEHTDQHSREDRETPQTAIEYVGPPKNYNILKLTLIDIGFLKTRRVMLDDQIELDLTVDPKPSKTQLDQRLWARILHNAWELIPPGGQSDSRVN